MSGWALALVVITIIGGLIWLESWIHRKHMRDAIRQGTHKPRRFPPRR